MSDDDDRFYREVKQDPHDEAEFSGAVLVGGQHHIPGCVRIQLIDEDDRRSNVIYLSRENVIKLVRHLIEEMKEVRDEAG